LAAGIGGDFGSSAVGSAGDAVSLALAAPSTVHRCSSALAAAHSDRESAAIAVVGFVDDAEYAAGRTLQE
jgi:hypothetical protein